MIDDAANGANTYWGGDDHGYGDVIGSLDKFDILGMDVYQTGSILTVDIFTNFAGRGDDSLYTSLTKRNASGYDESDPDNPDDVSNGIGYGDLFLANAWTPEGSDPNIHSMTILQGQNGNMAWHWIIVGPPRAVVRCFITRVAHQTIPMPC